MDTAAYFLTILVCAGGAFVQRVSGFGMGIFAMLFLPYILPSHGMAVTVMGLVGSVGAVYNAVRNWENIQWKLMLPLAGAAMAVIPLAVGLSADMPQEIFRRLLGAALIGLSIYFLFFSSRIHLKPTLPNALVAGAAAGVLNGLFNTGGPPAVLYLVHAASDKAAYFATIQAFFAVTNLFSTGNRVLNGLVTGQILTLAAVTMVGWGIGNALGGKVFRKIDANRLRKIIYIGMVISGVLMIV